MKLNRVRGFVCGRKAVDGISTWAVRVKEPDHPLDGKKFVVESVGADMWSLNKGDNVTFVPWSTDGVECIEFAALDVLRDKGRTLNWFERFILNRRVSWSADGGMLIIGSVLLTVCAWGFLYSYYTIPSNWFGSSIPGVFEKALVMLASWMLTAMLLPMIVGILWNLTVGRLQQILDYARREPGSPWAVLAYHAPFALGFGLFYYFGEGAYNGYGGEGWFLEATRWFISAMIAFPALASAFLALTAPFAVRGKSRPLFAHEKEPN